VVSYRIQRLENYLEFHLLNLTTKHFFKKTQTSHFNWLPVISSLILLRKKLM
jgi:hypothetical protein